MAFDAHKNFAVSAVVTAPVPASSGTSLVVTAGDGAKFPATPFNAVVCTAGTAPTTANAEIVRVTAVVVDTLTISRTQEGSSARAIQVGDQIYAAMTARTFTDIEAAITAITVVNPQEQNFRLTLESGVPVSSTDQTAKATLYCTPMTGNRIALYDGVSTWNLRTSAEFSIAVPASTTQMYDVFCYDNAGVPTLELLAWTNDTTRATLLVRQDGVWVKTGATTRRYLGSFRTTGVANQTEDSFAKRFVWNYYNRVNRTMKVFEATDNWVYSTAAYRQARATATNQVECVVGVAEVEVHLTLVGLTRNDTAIDNTFISISDQATTVSTTPDANVLGQTLLSYVGSYCPGQATLRKYPAIGHHVFGWLEQGSGANTTVWYGDNGNSAKYQCGLSGTVQG